jgi:putative spermidine/putrescine transport system ATP-binding protein
MALGDRIVVMRKGAIAQIGTPRDIYFTPSSRFVAEFVGAANIIEAGYRDGSLLFPGGKLAAACDGSQKDRVVVMIRPESIRIVSPDSAELCGQVEAVSFVGDRQRAAIGGVAAKAIMVDVPNSVPLKTGDRVGLAVDPSALRLLPGDVP